MVRLQRFVENDDLAVFIVDHALVLLLEVFQSGMELFIILLQVNDQSVEMFLGVTDLFFLLVDDLQQVLVFQLDVPD